MRNDSEDFINVGFFSPFLTKACVFILYKHEVYCYKWSEIIIAPSCCNKNTVHDSNNLKENILSYEWK